MRDINAPEYISEVAKIMESTGLVRVKVANQNGEIVLDKSGGLNSLNMMNEGMFGYSPHLGGANTAVMSAHVADSATFDAVTGASPATSQAAAPVTSAAAPSVGGTEIKSPIVGVFYNAPSPEAAPFVTIGATVKKGDVLCIIEAMKLMNEVTAECDGKILDIRVQNGDVVEFGTVLFVIE